MNRFVVIGLLSFLIALPLGAQKKVKVDKKSFYKNEAGFKEAWKEVRNGKKSYRQVDIKAAEALQSYKNAYTYNSDNAELNYLMGVCCLKLRNGDEAVQYLEKAYKIKPTVSRDVRFLLARAYQGSYQFEKAIDHYKAFSNSVTPKYLAKRSIDINRLIVQCTNGKELMKNPARVIITNLGQDFNSAYDDYLPRTSGDSLLYFTSRRPTKKNADKQKYDGRYSEGVYVSKKSEKGWQTPVLADKKFKSSKNDAFLGFSADGKTRYMYRGSAKGRYYYSNYDGKKWSSFKKVPKPVNSKYNEGTMSVSNDNTVYFISNRKDDAAVGKRDLYSAPITKLKSLKTDDAVNMGIRFNTPLNEEGVFVTSDGKTMYFSSEGFNSMGGYDIFVSRRDSQGLWTTPVNMGYPVNSPFDDLFIMQDANSRSAYYSTSKADGEGGLDIYKILFLGAEKQPVVSTHDDPALFTSKDKLSIHRQPIETIEFRKFLSGIITDSETGARVYGRVLLINAINGTVLASAQSDSLGKYRLELSELSAYSVEISAKDYLMFTEQFALDVTQVVDTAFRDFKVQKLKVGSKVVLKNIFFDTGKATLKAESYAELGRVLQFMTDNPSLKLEISGHTDNTGSKALNTKLSGARAQSVVDYLLTQGVAPERLVAKGYGPDQPVASNKTKIGREQNRRVEFKILGK